MLLCSRPLLFGKAALFLLAWALCAALVCLGSPAERLLAFLVGSWCIARAYYFVFHVLERYLGAAPYPGLLAMLRKCLIYRNKTHDALV